MEAQSRSMEEAINFTELKRSESVVKGAPLKWINKPFDRDAFFANKHYQDKK